ncbi:MAG: hypothetical protein Q9166_004709 [cf. Caloplaca sp. 2 TL-2023]
MDHPRLANLPPEILLRIFLHADDLATVNALVRSSSIFHCLWLLNANSIAIAVLPKVIECYDEAQCLVRAQELGEPIASAHGRRSRSHREAVIVLVRRYLANARLVCGFYQNNIQPVLANLATKGVDITRWPLLERTRFIRLLYQLKALAILHEHSLPRSNVLSPIGRYELIDLSELASWFRRESPLERRVELGVEALLADTRWLQKWMDIRWAEIHNRPLRG